MKRSRILHAGRVQWADVDEGGENLLVASSGTVAAADARWEVPILPGATIFALGLNYADHSKELGFSKLAEPLIFLKGHNTLVAHRGTSPRPADATQMHPECELVAIIGTPARQVAKERALDHVSGYTIACDYAIRNYLENYYRPNLRVKNRDSTTPIGPWIIDAADIPDPQALELSTSVNGARVQHGNTADMVFSVAELIAYISEFMTLMPGDIILTGTPHGVHFVSPGDEVACTIQDIGTLINYPVAPT